MSQKKLAALFPLFMVLFLDVAGIVLVLPVLTPLILDPHSTIIPQHTSVALRDFLYGFSLSLFPMFMFFSTPILGDLSDRFGRKKILLTCLLTSTLGYLIAAIGIFLNSLFILLMSRAVAGLAAGTQPIATAAIIDASTPETKTNYLAWVVFITSLGVILGPLLGGFTGEKSVGGWFGYPMPFLLAGLVSIANALLLFFVVTETKVVKKDVQIHWLKGLILFGAAFAKPKFRILSLLYFCFGLAWSLYYQAITWLFMEKYHYTVYKLGLFVAFLGMIGAVTTSLLAKPILKLFANDQYAYAVFIFLMAIANIAAAICPGEVSQWLWVILNASSEVLCFTVALNIFSNLVDTDSQGWIMGVIGSIGAITWTVGGLIAGPLGYISIHVPLWSAGILCLMSFGLILLYQQFASQEKSQTLPP